MCPTILATAPGHRTIAFLPPQSGIGVINNSTELMEGGIAVPSPVTSLLITSDGNRGFAAMFGANQIAIMDLGARVIIANVNTTIAPRKIVLSHNANTLVAFSDNVDSIEIFDTTKIAAGNCSGTNVCTFNSTIDTTLKTLASPQFDRPVTGVFSTDDSVLYVMNCGQECGGTAAGVGAYNVASGTVTANTKTVNSQNVPATIGILDGGNLIVGGTVPALAGQVNGGQVTKINPATMAIVGTPANLPDGWHDTIAAQAGKIFIGSRGCNGLQSCLGIYTGTTTGIDQFQGDVTSLVAISGRSVVYVLYAGELRIYDANTSAQTGNQLDIVGKAVDAKLVD